MASVEQVLQHGQSQYAVELSVIKRKALIQVAVADVEPSLLRFFNQVWAPFDPVILGRCYGNEFAQCMEVTAIVGATIKDCPITAKPTDRLLSRQCIGLVHGSCVQ